MASTPADDSTRERGPGEAFCRDCGAVIDARAEICPECGVRQRDPPKSSVDSALDDLFEGGNPFVAAVLSAVFPGLGQLYNRELERGLVFAVGFLVATASVMVLIGFFLAPAVWLYAVYDALRGVRRLHPGRLPGRGVTAGVGAGPRDGDFGERGGGRRGGGSRGD